MGRPRNSPPSPCTLGNIFPSSSQIIWRHPQTLSLGIIQIPIFHIFLSPLTLHGTIFPYENCDLLPCFLLQFFSPIGKDGREATKDKAPSRKQHAAAILPTFFLIPTSPPMPTPAVSLRHYLTSLNISHNFSHRSSPPTLKVPLRSLSSPFFPPPPPPLRSFSKLVLRRASKRLRHAPLLLYIWFFFFRFPFGDFSA